MHTPNFTQLQFQRNQPRQRFDSADWALSLPMNQSSIDVEPEAEAECATDETHVKAPYQLLQGEPLRLHRFDSADWIMTKPAATCPKRPNAAQMIMKHQYRTGIPVVSSSVH